MIRILYIDDDADAHRLLRFVLPDGYSLVSGLNGAAGFRLAQNTHPDVILLDVDLPDTNGIEMLKRIHGLPSPPPVIMLTGFGTINLAVRSIRAGATDFLEKPYERRTLLDTIRQAARARSVGEGETEYPELSRFVGESKPAREVRELIRLYARSGKPVLITGETGTGKDIVSRLIHDTSQRKERPYIAKNAGAIPKSIAETELFGSERGAYTDAVARPGSFELADTGTLFLDEIGEMDTDIQVKLLRAIEDRTVRRIGARNDIPIDVRIVSATNRDIEQAIYSGEFRLDLYYRISTLVLPIPPLRERKEDIPILVGKMLQNEKKEITRIAIDRLVDHSWPGNVRELKNVLERAAILSGDGPVEPSSIRFDFV